MGSEDSQPIESAAPEASAAGGKPVLSISVRNLVEFAFRAGDLGGERDFSGPNRALQGTRGHQRLQKTRPPGYQKEVSVRYDVETPDFVLRLQGRIDGMWPAQTEARGAESGAEASHPVVILEEIKTVDYGWQGEADPLHWAQVKIYGALYQREHPEDSLVLRLVYLDLNTGLIREFQQSSPAAELAAYLESAIQPYRQWMQGQWTRWQLRDASIRGLKFPFNRYRPGQRQLAVSVYKAARESKMLFVCAPTGIGKTMSVLYPAIKTLPEGLCAKVFYLTARTSGRQAAENALETMRQSGLRIRSVTLTAKQKICFDSAAECETLSCPYAIGYYDRVKAALEDLLERESLTRPVLEEVARKHQVCPFELSLDAALWSDVVICDYNYVFDPRAFLRRFFADTREDYLFLVDEAHNLVDRARDMFSASLEKEEILALKRALKPGSHAAEPLDKTSAEGAGVLTLESESPRSSHAHHASDVAEIIKALSALNRLFLTLRQEAESSARTSLALKAIPEAWDPAIRRFLQAAEEWLARGKPAPFREALIQLFFKANGFLRISELFDERFLFLWESAAERVRLFCLDPSHSLQTALERGRAAIFFSATLSPLDYFKELLGGRNDDVEMQLGSPFPPERFGLFVRDRIATHYRAREATFDAVAQAIDIFIASRVGNYLVFFPSYLYLNQVLERVRVANPSLKIKVQTPGMTITESEAFLASFDSNPDQSQAGFAVLGGIFGEGIDLAGGRLTGAVIVGVGLPQIGMERDLIRDFFETQRGAGFEYAYVFPGMNRVLQAAGRVIRSESDRGAVLLIDTRFSEHRYRRLFPPWWQPRRLRDDAEMSAALADFWTGEEAQKSSV